MSQEAVVKERKSIYIVWIIPFVAMAIAGWMIFKYYDEKGFDVVVTFNSGDGFIVGKTPLMYNGIKLGQVSNITIHPHDISKVDVTITVDKDAKAVAREGNIFWKVEPRLSLTEVSGLTTILGGVYINVMPSTNDIEALNKHTLQYRFEAAEDTPVNIFEPGVFVKLHAKQSDIKAGAPVMFRKIHVGKVLEADLTESGVEYVVHIEHKYSGLVKENSSFWKMSGIEVHASLAGLRVEMDSLASVVAGGIALNSPSTGKSVEDHKHEFQLFDSYDQVILDPDIITLVSKSGYNIDAKASNVFFKGTDAGEITSIDYDPDSDETTFKIRLKSSFRHLANKDAYFWVVEPHIGLNEIKGLNAIAHGRYITFETASSSKELKKKFILHHDSPPISGMRLKLVGDKGFNLKSGVNIIYRDMVIGAVGSVGLASDNSHIEVEIVIADQYSHLVNDSSNFYIQSALEAGASFDGIYFNVGSIASMVHGGIVLETNDLNAKRSTHAFELIGSNKEFLEREYVQSGGMSFMLHADSLGSIKKGSPVLFIGIKVGKVIDYILNKRTGRVDIKVYIEPKYCDQINRSTAFYNISGIDVKAGVDGVEINTGSIESIVTGGIAFKTPLHADSVKEMHAFELYESEAAVDEKYVVVTFMMEHGFNLKAGSKIIYKAITIGRIKAIELIDGGVEAVALIDQKHKALLAKDSIFWVEDVRIKFASVQNPSSLVTGAFIKVLPGKETVLGESFHLLGTAPVVSLNQEGLRVVVTGSRLSSLKEGSPVFYRQIKIGNVEEYRLRDDATGVELMLFIDKCYAHLVRENSLFYNATAMGMDVSLLGVKVRTETISTMINGGIALVTPSEPLDQAEEMQTFKLYDEPEDEWLTWAPTLLSNSAACE
ncbi:MAG: MlaD family protein [Campylobacterota bacterium]|nr:MlaD family protein [Campylobacterota bacterium]